MRPKGIKRPELSCSGWLFMKLVDAGWWQCGHRGFSTGQIMQLCLELSSDLG